MKVRITKYFIKKKLVSKLLIKRTKIRIYKHAMHGQWSLIQKEEMKPLIEWKIFRKLLGPVKRDDGSGGVVRRA